MRDQRSWGVDILTVGQYLQPAKKHLPIERYYTLEEFAEMKEYGLGLGFRWVESGPLVRSSYHAAEQVRALSYRSPKIIWVRIKPGTTKGTKEHKVFFIPTLMHYGFFIF